MEIIELYKGWIILVFGAVALLSALHTMRTGVISHSIRQRMGITRTMQIHRDDNPILFGILVFLNIVGAIGVAGVGVYLILHG